MKKEFLCLCVMQKASQLPFLFFLFFYFSSVFFDGLKKDLNISTTSMPMATKLSKLVTYYKSVSTRKSHDLSITWSCKVTWQTKNITSPLPQCLWPQQTLQQDCDIQWGSTSINVSFDPLITLSCNINRSCNITWQSGCLESGASTNTATWPFDIVIL